jgi:hypothetical protein
MKSAAEIEFEKREVIAEFKKSLDLAADRETAIMLALVRIRQLLDIIYPAPPRNDTADAMALTWESKRYPGVRFSVGRDDE